MAALPDGVSFYVSGLAGVGIVSTFTPKLIVMGILLRLLINALLVMILSWLLPGVEVSGFWSAVWVVIILTLLNLVVKPILVLFTIPITILTLGLFLLVINVIIIYLVDWLLAGFAVDGFLWALIFSLLLSLFNSALSGKD